jgi:hypothetical protein
MDNDSVWIANASIYYLLSFQPLDSRIMPYNLINQITIILAYMPTQVHKNKK